MAIISLPEARIPVVQSPKEKEAGSLSIFWDKLFLALKGNPVTLIESNSSEKINGAR